MSVADVCQILGRGIWQPSERDGMSSGHDNPIPLYKAVKSTELSGGKCGCFRQKVRNFETESAEVFYFVPRKFLVDVSGPFVFSSDLLCGLLWKMGFKASVCSHELIEESYVVLGEQTEVFHLIFQVCDAFDTHTEGISLVNVRVDAVRFEDVGVNHSASEDLHPSGMLAESTAFAAADVAGNVHFCRRFGEGEVGRTEADLGVCAKHLAGEGEKYLLQVGETHIAVDVKSFYLMEKAVCAGADCLISVHAARTNDADWRLILFHYAALY